MQNLLFTLLMLTAYTLFSAEELKVLNVGKDKSKSYKSFAQKNKTQFSDEWLKVPFNDVRGHLLQLSPVDCQYMWSNENKRLLALVCAMPVEITRSIVLELLDDEINSNKTEEEHLKKLDEAVDMFMAMPILTAFEEYQKVKDVFAKYPQLQGRSMGTFFRYTPEKRDRVLCAVVPSVRDRVLLGGCVATTQPEMQFLVEDEDVYRDFIQGQEVIEIDADIAKDIHYCAVCCLPRRPDTKSIFSYLFMHICGGGLGLAGLVLSSFTQHKAVGGCLILSGGGVELLFCGLRYCFLIRDLKVTAKATTL